uniref:NADH-ubiquinone oxidoreductase chain 6 n=1 Tax=Hydraena gracilis TaxID=290660 RepID=A0A7D7AUL6_9COLE|nr:NADH dehydrogenase subunit 6 [Hydraena gracilis]
MLCILSNLMLMNLMMSMMFLFMIHPLSMGMILLIQTILVSLITGYFFVNFWYSYILFIIMIGGMLVLFIYMTSVASNEKFKFSNKLMMMLLLMMTLMMMFMWSDNMYINIMNTDYNMNLNPTLIKFYNMPLLYIMFMMIIYLFITLIAVVKITEFKLGPLRQYN